MFRNLQRYLLSLTLPLLCSASTIGQAQDAATSAALVRPYLEPTTAAIVHLNLKECEGVLTWVEKQVPSIPPVLDPVLKILDKQQRPALAATGVTDLYCTLALQDVSQSGCVVFLPTSNPTATKAATDELLAKFSLSNYKTVAKSKLVIIATDKSLKRQIESPPRAANQLPASLQACFDTVVAQPLAVGVTVAKPMREEVSSMWPDRLPFALPIAMSPKQFLQDSQHVVVSLTRTPATKLSLQVRSDTSVPASSERNQKLLELVAATLEPYTGKLQVSHADSAAQLTADQSGIENVLKLVAGSALQQSSEASMSNQMKTVVLALHNYASAFQFITPRETRSADDKKLLSWRVHLLPFLAAQDLYNKFHLDEPWDSPHNIQLVAQMPDVYKVAGDGVAEGKTRFVLPMLPGSAWNGDGPPLKFEDLTDGTSVTLAMYIAPPASAVVWTKPEEPKLDENQFVQQMFGDAPSIIAALFDGSVHSLEKKIDPKTLKALITHQGAEVVDSF